MTELDLMNEKVEKLYSNMDKFKVWRDNAKISLAKSAAKNIRNNCKDILILLDMMGYEDDS